MDNRRSFTDQTALLMEVHACYALCIASNQRHSASARSATYRATQQQVPIRLLPLRVSPPRLRSGLRLEKGQALDYGDNALLAHDLLRSE